MTANEKIYVTRLFLLINEIGENLNIQRDFICFSNIPKLRAYKFK